MKYTYSIGNNDILIVKNKENKMLIYKSVHLLLM